MISIIFGLLRILLTNSPWDYSNLGDFNPDIEAILIKKSMYQKISTHGDNFNNL